GECVMEYDEGLISRKQVADVEIGPIGVYLKEGKLPDDNAFARRILLDVDNYILLGEHKVLMRRVRDEMKEAGSKLVMCVPRDLRKEVLEMHHDLAFGGANLGVAKVEARIRRLYYWPRLSGD